MIGYMGRHDWGYARQAVPAPRKEPGEHLPAGLSLGRKSPTELGPRNLNTIRGRIR